MSMPLATAGGSARDGEGNSSSGGGGGSGAIFPLPDQAVEVVDIDAARCTGVARWLVGSVVDNLGA